MFESIKQNDRQDAMKYVSSLLLSLLVHGALVCVLILVPLVFCNVLHPDEIIAFIMADPALPPKQEPPVPPSTALVRTPPEVLSIACRDCVPKVIPDGLRDIEPPIEEPSWIPAGPYSPISGISSQVPVGLKGIEGIIARNIPTVIPAPIRPKPKPPVVVVSSLQEAKIILKIEPVYPKLAVVTHTTGIVMLEATIDEEGNVSDLSVISGPALLVNAAREAVKQWKYSPTILNGEAVTVKTSVKVTFRIR
jgi:periplasmic protein TonB